MEKPDFKLDLTNKKMKTFIIEAMVESNTTFKKFKSKMMRFK